MKSKFQGFSPEALKFLRDLKKHNNRDWFEAHRETYLDAVKKPLEELTTLVSAELTRFAPRYATEPKRAIYRIHRDTRFSSDKTPYKNHAASLFYRADLGKNSSAAFYFQISPDDVGIGGGVYMTTPDQLRAIRVHLLDNHQRFRKIAASAGIKRTFGAFQGEALTRPPKGFDPEHPAMDLIRCKQFLLWREMDAKLALGPELFVEIMTSFEVMAPAIEFLNEPLASAAKKKEVNWLA